MIPPNLKKYLPSELSPGDLVIMEHVLHNCYREAYERKEDVNVSIGRYCSHVIKITRVVTEESLDPWDKVHQKKTSYGYYPYLNVKGDGQEVSLPNSSGYYYYKLSAEIKFTLIESKPEGLNE